MTYFAYCGSGEVDRTDARHLSWFSYKSQTGDVLSIKERQLPGKRWEREGAPVVETLLRVDVNYRPAERITLHGLQEAARLASMED